MITGDKIIQIRFKFDHDEMIYNRGQGSHAQTEIQIVVRLMRMILCKLNIV